MVAKVAAVPLSPPDRGIGSIPPTHLSIDADGGDEKAFPDFVSCFF